MKTVLITGANRGIGKEIAHQLGRLGFTVFVGARDKAKGEKAVKDLKDEAIDARLVVMDVNDEHSIQQAYEDIKNQISTLDVLINNAAVLLDEGTPYLEVNADMFRKTLHINSMGPFLVTQAFLPLLKRESRIINMSSGAGKICNGMSSWAPIYSISKTALNAVTLQLAMALENKGIVVNAVSPGWVRTDMGGSNANRSLPEGAETPVWLATEAPLNLSGKFFKDKREQSW